MQLTQSLRDRSIRPGGERRGPHLDTPKGALGEGFDGIPADADCRGVLAPWFAPILGFCNPILSGILPQEAAVPSSVYPIRTR